MWDVKFILELIISNKEYLVDDVKLTETQIFLIIFAKHGKWEMGNKKKGRQSVPKLSKGKRLYADNYNRLDINPQSKK